MRSLCALSFLASVALAACSGGSSTAPPGGSSGALGGSGSASARGARPNVAQCAAASPTPSPAPTGAAPFTPPGIGVPKGFHVSVIATVPQGPRELAFSPNGDLFVGTMGDEIFLIQGAEATPAGTPHVFTATGDSASAGVAISLSGCALYIGSQFAVWRVPYTIGDQKAQTSPQKIASVRPGGHHDHVTTSMATVGTTLYASVGSSCNACVETDPTRATIQQMGLHGENMQAKAVHIRNAIALAVNPATNTLWAGGAGQDSLPAGHPFEYFDPVSLHSGTPTYGWPDCEEDHVAYTKGANCSNVVVPLVENQAYETIIGAVFYPPNQSGPYAFPQQYLGGAFLSMHGSWHTQSNGHWWSAPRVRFVPITGDTPNTPVNWHNPLAQSSDFVQGFVKSDGVTRNGRPTGIAVGPQGDLFLADDYTGYIYRIRP